ncbi:hypothetical protein Tco_1485816 [Tanacetum coccineum]
MNTIELHKGNNVVPLRSDTIRLVQNRCSFHGLRSKDPNQHLKDFFKLVDSLDLHDETGKESAYVYFKFPYAIKLAIGLHAFQQDPSPHGRILLPDSLLISFHREGPLEDLALYDNKSWNDQRDLVKPVKAIVVPQDVPSTSDRRLIKLKIQVQRLMEAHLAPTQPTQVNKVSSLCKICSGPHDTQYCMKNPEQAFVDYTSSRINKVGGKRRGIRLVNLSSMVKGKEEVKEQGIDESEMETDVEVEEVIKDEESEYETDDEVEEILKEEKDDEDGENFNSFLTMEELTHNEWLLKDP